jgi:homocysteine S-methyltransferase
MSKHRHDTFLPISDAILTDGGLETTLVFHEGLDLPHFAAFPLMDSTEGRAALTRYYEAYLALAAERGLGFILDTPTWRANPDWAPRLGYDLAGLRRINRDSVAFLEALRARWQRPGMPIHLDGVIGPRGDGYKDGTMDPSQAEDYHAIQLEAFAGTAVDLVSAITMTTTDEAIGIARAAMARNLPHVISFTVETDGRLVGGATLREAIERTEEATEGSPLHYMVNCAHPVHFADALERGEAWAARIGGIRANASRLSHAELDEAVELDAGDPLDLGRRYQELRKAFPGIRVLGGCCGTDHRHVGAIRDACLPAAA